MKYFELKTLSGEEFTGWMKWRGAEGDFFRVARANGSEVLVPLSQVASIELFKEGDPHIPEWEVEQLALMKQVQV